MTIQAKLEADSLIDEVKKMKEVAVLTTERLDRLLAMLGQFNEKSSEIIQATIRQSFDSHVSRPLVGNAPVRKVFFRERKEAIETLRKISFDIEWSVCDFILEGTSLGRIQRMLDRLIPNNVNILCRSLIILNLYFDEKVLGQYPIRPLILQHMKQWTYIPEALLANEHSQSFLSRLAKPIYDMLKLQTLNRNRQRAYIEVVMLPDWVSLQNEANLVDMHFRQLNNLTSSSPPHFSQFVLTIVIRLMERFVASGLEVGLFCSHDELSHAYWYRDFLLSALLNNLTMMKQAKALIAKSRETARQNLKNARGKKKNHKNKPSGGNEPKPTEEDQEDELELSAVSLKRNLCRGTLRFLASLRQAGVLKDSVYEFTSTERIFAERFGAFELIRQPPPLTYNHYMEGSDFSNVQAADLQQTTNEWFLSCRRTVEQLLSSTGSIRPQYASMPEAELRSLLKVCVGNSVYLMKLRQITSPADVSKTSVEFDFDTHEQFCTIKLS